MNILPWGLQLFQISYLHQVELMPDSRFACAAELSLQPSSTLWMQRAGWLACFIHLKYNQGTVWRGKLLPTSEIIRFSSVHFSKVNGVPRLFSMDCCQLFKNIYSVHHAYYAIVMSVTKCNADSWVAKINAISFYKSLNFCISCYHRSYRKYTMEKLCHL